MGVAIVTVHSTLCKFYAKIKDEAHEGTMVA